MLLRDRKSCYNRTSARAFDVNGHDYAATARLCAHVNGRWMQSCIRGYGRDVGVDARFTWRPILAHCRLAGAGMGDCLYGAARTIGDTYAAKGESRAIALCTRAPSSERDACFAGWGVVVGLLNPTNATRASACRRAAGVHADACLESAIAEVEPSGRWSWG
jgi:hypothetical protein